MMLIQGSLGGEARFAGTALAEPRAEAAFAVLREVAPPASGFNDDEPWRSRRAARAPAAREPSAWSDRFSVEAQCRAAAEPVSHHLLPPPGRGLLLGHQAPAFLQPPIAPPELARLWWGAVNAGLSAVGWQRCADGNSPGSCSSNGEKRG
jgi:hypothetical protein